MKTALLALFLTACGGGDPYTPVVEKCAVSLPKPGGSESSCFPSSEH